MAWIDNIENIKFSIKTGDGKEYNPLWNNTSKTKSFNTTKYDFVNVKGSFIDRKKPQSGKYSLVFYFQGDDYIEKSNEFELSSEDPRPWTVTHPIYGTIKGQPTSISINNDSLNISSFVVEFWESIESDYPNTNTSIKDSVLAKTEKSRVDGLDSFVSNSIPIPENITQTKDLINFTSSKLVPDRSNSVRYENAVNKSEKSLDNLVSNTRTAGYDMQNIYNIAAEFETPVKDKINNFVDVYNYMKDAVNSVPSIYSKVLFESQGNDLISNMILSSSNPIKGDYLTRSDVNSVDDAIRSTYEDYLKQMDENQVSIYDVKNTYNPDIRVQKSLRELVTFNSKNLFLLAFNARQERTVVLEKDSNLLLLTHRFLGLDASDENINLFKDINNIGLNEIFQIRKGRNITYYV